MYPQNLAQKSISIWFLLELHNLMTYLSNLVPSFQYFDCKNINHKLWHVLLKTHEREKHFTLLLWGKKNKLLWQNFMSRIFSVNNLLLWCKSLIVLLRRTVSHKWLMETMRPPLGVQTRGKINTRSRALSLEP